MAAIRQYELVEKVRAYDPKVDEALLNKAYVFSMKAHGSQKRASGDPYFSHPLEVAAILTDLRLDGATIATALLHDTIEDTLTTYDEIARLFGREIARLVDGVTKLSRIELHSEASREAENFRKFLLAMSNDIRVLLVKLADRLHNMRTLHYIEDPEKRRRIALETMEIYAPLAERIGMQEMRDELEDTAFAQLNPDARDSITARLQFLRRETGDLKRKAGRQLRKVLKKAGLEATVTGREKRPYSIWRKMQENNVTFEQLSDIMAFRILVDDESQCYRALGVVHRHWQMVPGRFKDYISTPRRNGYQSIHTTVKGPERQRIEIQIRTNAMQQVAEWGVAAHWQYKQKAWKVSGEQYRWIRELLEILDHAANPQEFLENTKLEMFHDQVFCFTPKGDLIALPRGATPVDFAYAVHTDVGDTCVGAKVNGALVPLRTELTNGDEVEIVRSKAQTPSPAWENFVVSGKVRSAIRRFVRSREKAQFLELGSAILEKAFRQQGNSLTSRALKRAVSVLQYADADGLKEAVGKGTLSAKKVFETVFPELEFKRNEENGVEPFFWDREGKHDRDAHAVSIRGLVPGMAVHLEECCCPIPGDRIVGIIVEGEGIHIHTIDCERLADMSEKPDDWLDVRWEENDGVGATHVGRLSTILVNEAGALGTLATVIAKNHGNISNLKIAERSPQYFGVNIDVEVRDVKHLTNIMAALRATPSVNQVERVRG